MSRLRFEDFSVRPLGIIDLSSLVKGECLLEGCRYISRGCITRSCNYWISFPIVQEGSKASLDIDEYALPVASRFLSKKAHCRIPGAVLSIQEPAPIWNTFESDPCWSSKGACKMGNGRVRRKDKVEILHDRGRIDEGIRPAVEIVSKPLYSDVRGQHIQLIQAIIFLQADQTHAR